MVKFTLLLAVALALGVNARPSRKLEVNFQRTTPNLVGIDAHNCDGGETAGERIVIHTKPVHK